MEHKRAFMQHPTHSLRPAANDNKNPNPRPFSVLFGWAIIALALAGVVYFIMS